jgi:hypothetical protein
MQARPFLETPFAKKVVVAIEMRCGLDFTSPERTFCSHDLSNVEQVGPLPSPTTAGRFPALHVTALTDDGPKPLLRAEQSRPVQPCQPRPPRRYLQIIQHADRELAHYGSYAGVAITDINAYDAMQPVAEPATQLKRPRDMFVSAQGFLRDARMQRRLITFAAAHEASTLYVEASKAVTEGRQVRRTVASSPSVHTIARTSARAAHACSAHTRAARTRARFVCFRREGRDLGYGGDCLQGGSPRRPGLLQHARCAARSAKGAPY